MVCIVFIYIHHNSTGSHTSQVHNHTLLATFRQIFSEKEAGVKDSTAKLRLGDNGDDDGRFKMGTSGRVCERKKERIRKMLFLSLFMSFFLSFFFLYSFMCLLLCMCCLLIYVFIV